METKKQNWVIQCPKAECLNKDLDEIQWIEWYPEYSKLYTEDDGSVTINRLDGQIYYENGGKDETLTCMKCGSEWKLPENAEEEINWE